MYSDGFAYAWGITSSGELHTGYDLGVREGLRPVLNLAPNVKINGDGSAENPFRVID